MCIVCHRNRDENACKCKFEFVNIKTKQKKKKIQKIRRRKINGAIPILHCKIVSHQKCQPMQQHKWCGGLLNMLPFKNNVVYVDDAFASFYFRLSFFSFFFKKQKKKHHKIHQNDVMCSHLAWLGLAKLKMIYGTKLQPAIRLQLLMIKSNTATHSNRYM